MKRHTPLLLGSALALAGAAPAAAADVEVKGLDTLAWDKPTVSVAPGDTVTWTFAGTILAHNVQSAGTDWSFESPIAAPAPDASYTFEQPGTYRFVCQVHSDTMVGEVVVGTPPLPPPPPLSEQPWPNDGGVPGTVETGGVDDVAPTLRGVRVKRSRKGARLRFRVSERSVVTVRFKRGKRTVETRRVRASGRAGVRVPRRLRAGRYRIELTARDVAGNRSGSRSARITIR